MCGPELVGPLFAHGSAECDLAVVEGVMGLYDGAAGRGELASTAQVAKLLRAPVVLVVDASSQSRSVAALVHGFASFDPRVRLGGVILNKVGSDRHEVMLREALEEAGMPVLGVLRRAPQVATPSRHLGLVPVAERRADAVAAVAALAEQVRAGCDLEALLALARTAPPLDCAVWSPGRRWPGWRRGPGRRRRPDRPPGWPRPPHRSGRRGRDRWWPSPEGPPSRSPTPSTRSCSRPPGRRWSPSTRCGTRRCRTGRPAW